LGTLRKLSKNKEDFVIGIEATGSYGVTLAYFPLSLIGIRKENQG